MLLLVTPNFYIVTDHFINMKWEKVMKQKAFSNLVEFEHLIRSEVMESKLARIENFEEKFAISERIFFQNFIQAVKRFAPTFKG